MAQLGVSSTQVLNLFDDVYRRADALNPNKSQAQALQKEMRDNYSTYREAIVTAYTSQERSDGNGWYIIDALPCGLHPCRRILCSGNCAVHHPANTKGDRLLYQPVC